MAKSFGDYLIEIRGRMSLRDAAKRIKISHTYLRDLELGVKTDPSYEVLQKISHGYGVPLAELTKMASGVAIDEVNKKFGSMIVATSLQNFLTQVESGSGLLKNGQLTSSVRDLLNQVLKEDHAAGVTADNFLEEVKNIRDELIQRLRHGEDTDELVQRHNKINRARNLLYKLSLGQTADDMEVNQITAIDNATQLLVGDVISTHYELSKILGPISVIPVHFNNRFLKVEDRRRVLEMLSVLFPDR